MKRILAAFAALLLLCGCGKGNSEMDQALAFRTRLLSAGGCTFSCDVTADVGDAVYEFSMDCKYADGEGSFTVTAPESIAGISATVDNDGATLHFDDIELTLGEMAEGRIAPLGVPWLLGSAWQSDYISAAGKENGLCRVTILKGYDDDEITVETYLSDGVPVRAEASVGGKRVLTMEISDFAWANGSGNA